jgi:succinate dehydrogenase/fumarate reductase flavoprotein subunit
VRVRVRVLTYDDEWQCKSVESLLKQTREELVAEVEQERQRVVDSEVKVRKTADRFKKQLDEALEETRASIEVFKLCDALYFLFFVETRASTDADGC